MTKIIVKNLKYINDDGELLFEDLDFVAGSGERIGLIGNNGSGKTTLLKILLGQISKTEGEINIVGNNKSLEVGYIPQQKDGEGVDAELKNLSGGEYIRYFLQKLKNKNPEIILMDEPTNHLDTAGRKILVDFIKSFPGVLIVVSHDVAFLNTVANRIFKIHNQKLSKFGGNYDDYKNQFQEYLDGVERQRSSLKKEEKKLKRAQEIELARRSRSVKAGRELRHDGSMGKLEKGYFKDQSEFAHSK